MNIEVSISLDDDGFVDRQCPTCSRVFCWLPSDHSEPPPDGRYGSPYGGGRNDPGDFWTEEQREFLTQQAGKPVLSGLEAAGWEVSQEGSVPEPVINGELAMVSFPCHPGEPVKVYAEWTEAGQPVGCLICGGPGEP